MLSTMKVVIFVTFVLTLIKLANLQPLNGTHHMVGALRSIKPDNAALLSAMGRVEPEIEQSFGNSPFVHRIGNILQAFSQVVSGVKFYVILDVVEQGNCLKSASSCAPTNAEQERHFLCGVVIWTQAWRNYYHLEHLICSDQLSPNHNISLPVLFNL